MNGSSSKRRRDLPSGAGTARWCTGYRDRSDAEAHRALAQLLASAHIQAMANRPCKLDADLKRLWQTLLPGTPMPACGVDKDADTASEVAKPAKESRSDQR